MGSQDDPRESFCYTTIGERSCIREGRGKQRRRNRQWSVEVLTLFATVSQGMGVGVSGRNREMDELPAVLAPCSAGGCL